MSLLNYTNYSQMNVTTILHEYSNTGGAFDFWFFFLIALTIILITATLVQGLRIACVSSTLVMLFISYIFSILELISPQKVIYFIAMFLISLTMALIT